MDLEAQITVQKEESCCAKWFCCISAVFVLVAVILGVAIVVLGLLGGPGNNVSTGKKKSFKSGKQEPYVTAIKKPSGWFPSKHTVKKQPNLGGSGAPSYASMKKSSPCQGIKGKHGLCCVVSYLHMLVDATPNIRGFKRPFGKSDLKSKIQELVFDFESHCKKYGTVPPKVEIGIKTSRKMKDRCEIIKNTPSEWERVLMGRHNGKITTGYIKAMWIRSGFCPSSQWIGYSNDKAKPKPNPSGDYGPHSKNRCPLGQNGSKPGWGQSNQKTFYKQTNSVFCYPNMIGWFHGWYLKQFGDIRAPISNPFGYRTRK